MPSCAYCGAPTQLFDNDVPVCLRCEESRSGAAASGAQTILDALKSDLAAARWRVSEETRQFDAVMGDVPSGIPHPDGLERILRASKQLAGARQALGEAHDRLNAFVTQGIVPEHLRKNPASDNGGRGKAGGSGAR